MFMVEMFVDGYACIMRGRIGFGSDGSGLG